jgi:hypothetical protein
MSKFTKGEKHLCLHFPISGILMEPKGTRSVPYSLVAVHEEAGDECAHGQLIADRFHL